MSDATIVAVVSGVITVTTMIIGFLTLWVKLRYGVDKTEQIEEKVDHNTKLTRAGTDAAIATGKTAAATATDTKNVVESMSKKLNGGIDASIQQAVAPIRKMLEEHTVSDDKSLGEINTKFELLSEYVHKRNHDVLDSLGVLSNKLESLLIIVQQDRARK